MKNEHKTYCVTLRYECSGDLYVRADSEELAMEIAEEKFQKGEIPEDYQIDHFEATDCEQVEELK